MHRVSLEKLEHKWWYERTGKGVSLEICHPKWDKNTSNGLSSARSWDRSLERACLEAGGGSRAFLWKSPS